MTREAIESLSKAKRDLQAAKARNSGMTAAKEKMKNLLFNYYEDLVSLAEENEKLKADVAMLETALSETDQENDELRKKLKAAETKPAKGNAENAEGE